MISQAKKHSAVKCGVLFLLLLLGQASYLAESIAGINMAMGIASIILVGYNFKRIEGNWNDAIISVVLVSIIILGKNNEIFYAIAGCIYYVKYSKCKPIEWTLIATLVTYLLIKTIYFERVLFVGWGLIYYWSIPAIISMACVYAVMRSQGRWFLLLLVLFGGIIEIYSYVRQHSGDKDINLVINKDFKINDIYGGVRNIEHAINQKLNVITSNEFNQRLDQDKGSDGKVIYIASLAVVPDISTDMILKKMNRAEYVIFGEHDGLNGFSFGNSLYKKDEYKRKGPWGLYKPLMAYSTKISSSYDPAYCSNIGCSIRNDLTAIPLMWDYDRYGGLVLIASRKVFNNGGLTIIGDSDPLVGFLSIYNKVWLRNIITGRHVGDVIISRIALLVIGFLISLQLKNTVRLLGLIFISLVSARLISQPNDDRLVPNILVHLNRRILSPHYEWHYSSLPKNIAQQGYTVSLGNKGCADKIFIAVAGKHSKLSGIGKNVNAPYKIIILTEGSNVEMSDGRRYKGGEIPLKENNIRISRNMSVSYLDPRMVIRDDGQSRLYYNDQDNNTLIISSERPSSVVIEEK